MDNPVPVQIVHAMRDLFGPAGDGVGGDFVAVLDEVEEGAEGAVLHHDPEHWGRHAHAPGGMYKNKMYKNM